MANSVIKVKVDMSGVASKIRKICTNKQLGQELASRGKDYMNAHYVPKRSGELRDSVIVKPFKITWTAPYARRHYYGYGDSNRTTEGTTSHWDAPPRKPNDVRDYLAKVAQDWMKRH